MIIMAALEAKGYKRAYKEVVCFLIAGLIIGAVLWLGVVYLTDRGSLFEPFTVGIVDQDGTPELIFIFDFFNEHIIDLEFMEMSEALKRLESGDIPAFIELPENFTRDVFQGINSPFTVHLNNQFPLQSGLVQLLATGGIAFLSTSQAGVYAALEYAYNAGWPWEDVQRNLLIPVNMAFAQELILHDNMFMQEVIPMVEGSATHYFVRRFAIFWHMLCLLALVRYLPWYPAGVAARFKLAGVTWPMVLCIKWIGLFVPVALLSIPIIPIVGIAAAFASSVFVTSFGVFSGKLLSNDGTRGLFIFFVALVMYFASGGIIPFAFLPQELLFMRFFSVNWLLQLLV